MSIIEVKKHDSLQKVKGHTNRERSGSDNNDSCPPSHDHDIMKIKQDYGFIRDATASIANALLRLGGTSDCSINSMCTSPMRGRKRTVSVVADALVATDGDVVSDSETETESIASANKRPRKEPIHGIHSQSIQATKTSLPVSIPLLTGWKTLDRVGGGSFSFAANEFQINQLTRAKIPGELEPISDCLYNFRPLRSAPSFPSRIVPPTLPPCNSPNFLANAGPPVSSAVITEHTGCYIMHSYTILPRQVQHPPLPSHSPKFNAMPHYHQQ